MNGVNIVTETQCRDDVLSDRQGDQVRATAPLDRPRG